ncbi:MAG: M6 family metalloprotease domain-containing protein [Dysgonamonadaceae bacterium]|nr:M6 family metalloprotease domain-containing protein [Dysgonamonadaceae bacterium]
MVLSDGTKISYFVRGDERVHWLQSTDGYTLLFDSNQNLVYAEKDSEGNLVPSTLKYGDKNLIVSKLNDFLVKTPKDLRYSKTQVATLIQIWKMTESEVQKSSVIGPKKAICVLMGFKNRPFTKTIEEFENLMNQVGYSTGEATGSVKDFYRENSYGQMDLTVTVVGPYTTENNASYYCTQSYDMGYQYFASEAIHAADDDVDFSEFANENGELETFHVIFAGYGAENGLSVSNYIWSHKWEFYTPLVLDGVKIAVYSCSPELRGSSGSEISDIGVICHELCHVFGADDYYDTDYEGSGGNYLTTGAWDLMAYGCWNNSGCTPAHINMFQKILYGWVKPMELNSPKTIENMPNSAENPVALTIKPHTNDELYVLENRQQKGFDKFVPGNGLLIYHIHNSAANGSINNTQHPQQAYVVSANALQAIPSNSVSSYGNISTGTAPFAAVAGKNTFSGTSTPRMFRWNGNSGIVVEDKPVTEITQTNEKISFKFQEGRSEDEEPRFNPVKNLQYMLEENIVTISWDLPDNDIYPDSFRIYCDNELISELPVNIRNFSDDTKTLGDIHNYCVEAIYQEGIADKECVEVDFSIYDCLPVKNLTATINQDLIQLTWENPYNISLVNYKYDLYLENEPIEKDLENTYFSYTVPKGDSYNFSVIAHSETCESEPVNIKVTYITISKQPENATICEGEEYTLRIEAEPENLIYQWYHNDALITEATEKEYTIQVNEETVGSYYAVLKSSVDDTQLQTGSVSIAMISASATGFEFTGIPEKLYINETYFINLEPYPEESLQITNLNWNFSNDLATIVQGETANSIVLTTGPVTGTGILSVDISYLCGKYTFDKTMIINNTDRINLVSETPFVLYPNPVSEALIVSDNAAISVITITDVDGRVIYANSYPHAVNKQIINTSSWSKGIYFVRLLSNSGVKVGKLMKN